MGFFKRIRVMLGLASEREEEQYDPLYKTDEPPRVPRRPDHVEAVRATCSVYLLEQEPRSLIAGLELLP